VRGTVLKIVSNPFTTFVLLDEGGALVCTRKGGKKKCLTLTDPGQVVEVTEYDVRWAPEAEASVTAAIDAIASPPDGPPSGPPTGNGDPPPGVNPPPGDPTPPGNNNNCRHHDRGDNGDNGDDGGDVGNVEGNVVGDGDKGHHHGHGHGHGHGHHGHHGNGNGPAG
jgi:hypothetical protein